MNGIDGKRETYRCPKCKQTFTFWRPAELPGAKVKCCFCKTEFEDDAAKRPAAVAPPPPPAAPPAPPQPEPVASPETPASPEG